MIFTPLTALQTALGALTAIFVYGWTVAAGAVRRLGGSDA